MKREDFELSKFRFVEHMQKRNWSESTIAYSISSIDKFYNFVIKLYGEFDFKDISRDLIDQFHSHLLEYRKKDKSKLKQRTVISFMYGVKRYFRFLINERYILFDPTDHLRFKKIRKDLSNKILSIQQIKKLLDTPDLNDPIQFRDRCMLELFYSSGLRRDEMRNINMYDIDLESGFVRVKGKGKKERVVPVGKVACKYIKEYLNRIRPEFVKRTVDQSLFVTHYGKKIHNHGIAVIVKRYMKKAGLKGFSTHSLRHTFATHLLQQGCGIKYIQEMLGHSNISTTQIYTQVIKSDLQKVHKQTHPEGQKEDQVKFHLEKGPCRKGFYFRNS